MNFVTASQVRQLRSNLADVVTLDVRIPEVFAEAHLPGAVNACVFTLAFLDEVRRIAPNPAAPLIVYGEGPGSFESTDAVQRLAAAGYRDLHNFPGGMVEWRRDGLPVEGAGPRRPAGPMEGRVPLDLTECRIEWTGRNLLNKHHGTVGLRSGYVELRQGWMTAGEVVLDMTSLRCLDVTDPAQNHTLITHLWSADFFDISRHPEARLAIRSATPLAEGRPGTPNLHLHCEFTLRGATRPIVIPAAAGRTPEGRLAAQAVFAFDRTEYGSAYGSSRFFQHLGRHLVNDLVEIQARILA